MRTSALMPMTILPELIAPLRSRLSEWEELHHVAEQHNALLAPAQAAADRLRKQIKALNHQIANLVNQHIPADDDRVARLIAGAEVAHPDRKTVEGRALKEAVVNAERRQVEQDLAAVETHLAGLTAKSASLAQSLCDAEKAFLGELSGAVVATYKRNAIAFVRAHVPTVFSVAEHFRSRTGALSGPADKLLPGPRVDWREEEMRPNPLGGESGMVPVETQVWPRRDYLLLSGEPVHSGDLVEALIATIRDSGEASKETRHV